MKQSRHALSLRHLSVLYASLLMLLGFGASCDSHLPLGLEGLNCDSSGRCLAGYVCDPASNKCVRPEKGTSDNGTAGEGDGGPGKTDEISCNGNCANPSRDAKNCGGCGATCSSPANGAGICLDGACNFACTKPFSPCGTSCLDLAQDPNN